MLLRLLVACSIAITLTSPALAGDTPQRTGKDSVALLATAAANPAPSAAPTTASSAVALAQPSGFTSWPTLTGNWGGARSHLEDAGFVFSAMYRTDQMSNMTGGNDPRGGSINQADLQLSINANALLGIQGLTIFAHVIANNGGSISRWVGDEQIVSNLESTRLTKLYQVWIRQAFLDDHMSVLAGMYDLNSEFYANDAAGLFLNSSFGVGKELAQAGMNGPGIFPNPALTLRLRGDLDGYYAQVAVLDGHPGRADDPFSPSFSWSKEEGVLLIAEGGAVSDGSDGGFRSKFAAGAWWLPSSTEMPLPNGGAYILAETQVYRETSAGQGLTVFSRVGVADLRVNRFRANVSAGAVYLGPIPGRDDDKFGLGVTMARRNQLLDAPDAVEEPDLPAEISIEMAYRIQLLPSIGIQPDLQYVIGPGCARDVRNATVFGVRFEGHF